MAETFTDEIRKRLQKQSTPYGDRYEDPVTGTFYPGSQVDSNMSPEAAATMNSGSQAGAPKAPSPENASADMANRLRDQGFGADEGGTPARKITMTQSDGGDQSGQRGATQNASQAQSVAPLPLGGKPFVAQAQILTNYLKSLGLKVPNYVVGGTSPLDTRIISLIDQINDPNATDEQRKLLGGEIVALAGQRGDVVTGTGMFRFNTETGTAEPWTRDANYLTGQLNPLGGIDTSGQATAPRVDPALINRLLESLSGGGDTAEQQRTQESKFVSDVEDATARRRQLLADRLGASGSFGGAAQEQLNSVGSDADKARASGLADIRSSILQQRAANQAQALTSALQLAGINASEAQSIAQNVTQRMIAQAQLAQSSEQSAAQLALQGQIGLGNQQLNLGQQGLEARQQNMTLVAQLLSLESQVDAQSRAAIENLINQLLTGAV